MRLRTRGIIQGARNRSVGEGERDWLRLRVKQITQGLGRFSLKTKVYQITIHLTGTFRKKQLP